MKGKILGGLITILFSGLLFFCGMDKRVVGSPLEAYQVYLDGEKIGLINSKEELLTLIDTEQSEIKKSYGVDKVYPPSGLDIKKVYTYNDDVVSSTEIYDKIKDIEPFTIEGYTATVTYTEKKINNDGEVEEDRHPVHLFMLDKKIFEESLYNTAVAFIGTENLTRYEEGTQKEITETGEKITSVYFEETMTIKKSLISTEEYIFRNTDDLSKYLLFGTVEEQSKYTIKEGEDLNTIADEHNLNIEELLIANPQYPAANVLVTAGDEINVGLINPIVSVVYNKTIVEDIDVAYKEETIKDKTKYTDYKEVRTKGVNGVSRITQNVKFINGEIKNLEIDKTETLKEPINQVTVIGTKSINIGGYYYYDNSQGNDTWSWPTITPFIITSRYKWRWGRQHQGIDISGCGYGSPIYAVKDGVVIYTNRNASKSEGLAVYIDHGNGYITQYMHLSRIHVSPGQVVKREQKIGAMGSTGASTGTHLHLGVVVNGIPYQGGTFLDPCTSIFKC